eukprot:873379_1
MNSVKALPQPIHHHIRIISYIISYQIVCAANPIFLNVYYPFQCSHQKSKICADHDGYTHLSGFFDSNATICKHCKMKKDTEHVEANCDDVPFDINSASAMMKSQHG